MLSIKSRPKDKLFRVTLGSGRGKVTATFFHPKRWIQDQLTKGTRVMLSGEVGYFRGAMQLTHPDFLVLDSADGKNHGSRALKMIATASQAVSGEVLQQEFERTFYPIYPASTKVQSWDIFNCVRQVLDVLDPVPDPLPRNSVPHISWLPKTSRCVLSTWPRTTPTDGEPVNDWPSTRRWACSGRW